MYSHWDRDSFTDFAKQLVVLFDGTGAVERSFSTTKEFSIDNEVLESFRL